MYVRIEFVKYDFPAKNRRRLGIGADCEEGQKIREGSKRGEFRWYSRKTANSKDEEDEEDGTEHPACGLCSRYSSSPPIDPSAGFGLRRREGQAPGQVGFMRRYDAGYRLFRSSATITLLPWRSRHRHP
jgi:hypothetical protein